VHVAVDELAGKGAATAIGIEHGELDLLRAPARSDVAHDREQRVGSKYA
jgi:hypothetical protein